MVSAEHGFHVEASANRASSEGNPRCDLNGHRHIVITMTISVRLSADFFLSCRTYGRVPIVQWIPCACRSPKSVRDGLVYVVPGERQTSSTG